MTLASSAKILQEKVCDFLMFQFTHSLILLSLLFCAVPIQRSKSCHFQIKIHEIGQYFSRLYTFKSTISFGSNLNIILEMIIMRFQSSVCTNFQNKVMSCTSHIYTYSNRHNNNNRFHKQADTQTNRRSVLSKTLVPNDRYNRHRQHIISFPTFCLVVLEYISNLNKSRFQIEE